jgi:hypothetical protein
MNIILSEYNTMALLLISSTITAKISANFDSLEDGMRIFFTPASILA